MRQQKGDVMKGRSWRNEGFAGRAELIAVRLFPHELELLERLIAGGRTKTDAVRAALKALAESEGVEVPSPVGKNTKAVAKVCETGATAF